MSLSRDPTADKPAGVWIHDLKVLGTASKRGLALAILEKPGGETIVARVGFRVADGWLAAVSGPRVIFMKEESGGGAIPYSEVVKEVGHADSLPQHGSADN